MNSHTDKTQRLVEAAIFYQGILLDVLEQEVGDKASWSQIRARVLRAFGDRGLANKIRMIMNDQSDLGGGGER